MIVNELNYIRLSGCIVLNIHKCKYTVHVNQSVHQCEYRVCPLCVLGQVSEGQGPGCRRHSAGGVPGVSPQGPASSSRGPGDRRVTRTCVYVWRRGADLTLMMLDASQVELLLRSKFTKVKSQLFLCPSSDDIQ